MLKEIKKTLKALYFLSYTNAAVSRIRGAFQSFENEYRNERTSLGRKIVSALTPELKVIKGPFEGMKYPSLRAAGSVLVPKLIGTYEIELTPYIIKIKKSYSIILNIGSAEGYYAVGLALRSPGSRIVAFDIDEKARELLAQMIRTNNVQGKVSIAGLCHPRMIGEFANKKRGLVISDCEGCELDLFNTLTVRKLRDFDFLIETHDSLDVNITRILTNRFRKTHGIHLIKGRKRSVKDFPASSEFTPMEKRLAMQEGRHRMPKWLFMESISSASEAPPSASNP